VEKHLTCMMIGTCARCQSCHLSQIVQLDIECAALSVGDRLLQSNSNGSQVIVSACAFLSTHRVQRTARASAQPHQNVAVLEVSIDFAMLQKIYCCRCTAQQILLSTAFSLCTWRMISLEHVFACSVYDLPSNAGSCA
jgi:hypothetical protein